MPKDNNIIHAHTRGYAKRAALSAALFVYTCYPMKERVGFPIAEYEEISPMILRKRREGIYILNISYLLLVYEYINTISYKVVLIIL